MIICPHCEGENREGAAHCRWCGEPLSDGPQPESPNTPLVAPEAPADSEAHGQSRPPGDDPLAGLDNLLPEVPLPDVGGAGAPSLRVETTEAERRDADLFHRLATEPPPLEPPRPARALPAEPALPPRARPLFGTLILLAVLAPLLTSRWRPPVAATVPQAAALAGELARLNDGDRLLVVYDYAPSASGELQPMVDILLAEVASRSVRLLALSTRPEGVDLARQSLASLGAPMPQPEPGNGHVHLGYLPGDAAGLRLAVSDLPRALAYRDAGGRPLERVTGLDGVQGVGDVDGVLLLTDDAGGARRWLEQVGTRTSAPLYALTTARVEPFLLPYARTGQLAGLASGAYGGLAYANAEPGARARLYGSDGYLAFWGVLALALVAGLVHRPAGKKAAQP